MKLRDLKSSQYIKDTSRDFALYVAENRGIPRITDGLKDSTRKALWVMRNKGDKMKTSALSGEMVAENLYHHGDASGAISGLAAPFQNNMPLLYGDGNFGTRVDPGAIGAPRYTYVKRTNVTNELVYPDLDIVPLKENFDGSGMEPVTFLPIIPLVLLNGIAGIAVGWSTEILPHSFADLCKATIQAIDGKKISPLKPTYSWSNCVATQKDPVNAPNSWEFAGKVAFVDSSTIRVVELPPGLILEKFREKLDDLQEKGTIRDYEDNSSEEINLTVKFRRGSVDENLMDDYIGMLSLRTRNTERIVAIDWGFNSIKQYASAEEVVKDFVEWRFGYYIKRYEKFLADSSEDLNFWLGVKACFDADLPKKVQSIQSKKDLIFKIEAMIGTLPLTNDQVDRIASFATYRWTKDALQEVLDKISQLNADIATYKDLLANPQKIRDIYKIEVQKLSKLS